MKRRYKRRADSFLLTDWPPLYRARNRRSCRTFRGQLTSLLSAWSQMGLPRCDGNLSIRGVSVKVALAVTANFVQFASARMRIRP